MFPALKNNTTTGCQGPVKIELLNCNFEVVVVRLGTNKNKKITPKGNLVALQKPFESRNATDMSLFARFGYVRSWKGIDLLRTVNSGP